MSEQHTDMYRYTSVGSIPSLWQASRYIMGFGFRIPSRHDCNTTSKCSLRNLLNWFVWLLVSSIQLLVITPVLNPNMIKPLFVQFEDILFIIPPAILMSRTALIMAGMGLTELLILLNNSLVEKSRGGIIPCDMATLVHSLSNTGKNCHTQHYKNIVMLGAVREKGCVCTCESVSSPLSSLQNALSGSPATKTRARKPLQPEEGKQHGPTLLLVVSLN